MKTSTWNCVISAVAGISAAIFGTAALDQTLHTWPTIVIVIGVYAAASGIRGLRC